MLRRRLPKPTDPGDEKVLADIRKFGFHAKHVRPWHHPEHAQEKAELGPHAVYDVGLSYTVGLPYSHGHPELAITTGMPDKQAHGILWAAVHLIEDGAAFAPGDESDRILADAVAHFGPVSEHWRKEVLTFSDWAARRKPFDALQVLLPDRAGVLPTDAAYEGPPQPLLA